MKSPKASIDASRVARRRLEVLEKEVKKDKAASGSEDDDGYLLMDDE